ncbi:MAG: argininosuccinate synthase [Phycisphaerales bacterium]|nr:argininosuccinate synthase [Phycisphaerales bacterium]
MSNPAANRAPRKIVLAYSGGLDTSVILPWLKDRYPGVKLVAYAADLGQGEGELAGIEDKAMASGADEVIVDDLRREFAEDYCFAMLRAHAIYEQDYLLGTSIARPLIAKGQVEAARRCGADALGHGATGKGNDQVRFELTYMALAPDLQIIAPWKDPSFELTSREAAIDYAKKKNVPIAQSKAKIYSRDRNLWHCSHEGAEIEHPDQRVRDDVWLMTEPMSETPDEPETLTVTFDRGNPVALNGQAFAGHDMIAALNAIGGRHAVGQIVMVENRLIGMKSRGAYETPGGTILYAAHKALEQLCLERDTLHFKQIVAMRYAELTYFGQWFHPLREALQAFVDHTQGRVRGTVTIELYKGHASAVSATSDTSLYDPKLASFAMDGYDVTAARGFIDLFGLPMKVAAMKPVPAPAR